MSPIAKRHLELRDQGVSLRQIAAICGKEYLSVYQAVRYWTDDKYRASRKKKSHDSYEAKVAVDPEYATQKTLACRLAMRKRHAEVKAARSPAQSEATTPAR